MAAKRPISTIREQVYQILRDDICQGVYAPGTRLQEVDLAENLNVSRSPVREALRQLAADGLLLEIPNKGVYVKEFTAKDIGEIYDLRVMLESYGIFHSAGHITSARRERLLRFLAELVPDPMTPEEAILQMNLLDHTFYVFKDEQTGETNVVYKREAGSYGLIVPEENK